MSTTILTDAEIFGIFDTCSDLPLHYEPDEIYAMGRAIEQAVLQSQDQEDALVQAIQEAIALLGPKAPSCSGCEYEWNHALRALREAIDHARRIEENE